MARTDELSAAKSDEGTNDSIDDRKDEGSVMCCIRHILDRIPTTGQREDATQSTGVVHLESIVNTCEAIDRYCDSRDVVSTAITLLRNTQHFITIALATNTNEHIVTYELRYQYEKDEVIRTVTSMIDTIKTGWRFGRGLELHYYPHVPDNRLMLTRIGDIGVGISPSDIGECLSNVIIVDPCVELCGDRGPDIYHAASSVAVSTDNMYSPFPFYTIVSITKRFGRIHVGPVSNYISDPHIEVQSVMSSRRFISHMLRNPCGIEYQDHDQYPIVEGVHPHHRRRGVVIGG